MASRALTDLHPDTRRMASQALEACANDLELYSAGITVLVTCTYRQNAEQALAYAQGRTREQLDAVGLTDLQPRKGAILTKARPGESAHNAEDPPGTPAARAIDVVPLLHGKPLWGTDADTTWIWLPIAAHFKAAGFRWFGEPEAPFREFPHFQDPAWRRA